MRDPWLIWGAGAVGGTLGAYLARAGEPVLFVDSVAEHVATIRDPGLAIEGPVETFRVAAPAVVPAALGGRFRRILLAVKAHHTAAAARQLAPFLAPDGYVVSVQNGLNELELAEILARERVVGCFINFGADYLEPGRILFGGRAAVVVGELDGASTPRLAEIHAAFRKFEPEAIATDDIWGYLWGKLGYGALLFATALTDRSIAQVLASEPHRPLLTDLAREVMALARAHGVVPRGFNGFEPGAFAPDATPAAVAASFHAMVEHNARSAKTHSGIYRDLAVRRRKTEVDAQIAVMLPLAAEAGVAMPLTTRLVDLVHDIEEGRRAQSWDTLDALGGSR